MNKVKDNLWERVLNPCIHASTSSFPVLIVHNIRHISISLMTSYINACSQNKSAICKQMCDNQ